MEAVQGKMGREKFGQMNVDDCGSFTVKRKEVGW